MKMLRTSRKHHYVTRVGTFLLMVALIAGMAGCGGSGSAIKIRTWYDLDDIRDGLTKNYVLMNDLDSTTAGYEELAGPTANGGKGWDPIGGEEFGNVFWGTFDGDGHKICDLFINRPSEKDVGLFGTVGQGLLLKGVIRNLGVVNVTVTGDVNVACLVGATYVANTVTNCYATGTVTGLNFTGGLMGFTHSGCTVSLSYFDGTVTGHYFVGGLVGSNRGIMTDCYATGTVTGDERVGGLSGQNVGNVNDSYSTGTVTGSNLVGGLAGISFNITSNCHATGNVIGGNYAGGLLGSNYGVVNNCWATGSVTGGGQVGGLVGLGDGPITDSYSTGNVAGYGAVGGLLGLGYDASTVTNCYSTGNVTGEFNYVGGLAGSAHGTVSDSYATGSVTGSDHVGGLAGIAHNVSNCYATGDVTGDNTIGGLVGWHTDGTVSYSYATGSVAGSYSGGLVGVNGGTWVSGGLVELNDNDSVAIYYCYSTGSVTGDTSVGGLVGENAYSTVSNSYSSGNVTGGSRVGGLVGWHWGDVSDSYAIGSVTGNTLTGGLVGDSDSGTVSNSFWDIETSGQGTSDGGTGKNTTEMKDITTFTDTETEGLDEPWDIIAVANPSTRNPSYIWNIVDNVTYLFLSWQPV